MLEDLLSPPIWLPENSVNIWNLLWLSRRLIIRTEPKHIYKNTFPNTVTPKMAKNHEISVYLSWLHVTHGRNSKIQNALVSKRRTLLSWKVANRYKFSTTYA